MHTAATGSGPMEQIYYTQCPMGYGLGASNGFQIKRLSPGFPPSGDFRHLGMRAFLPGSRLLAPCVLRYRRDGDVAEVAWLTPRPQEYETERGLWGRPGGQFAHGVRLGPQELVALANWPAGLDDWPFWCRSDPRPTRGSPPTELPLGAHHLAARPAFAAEIRDDVGLDHLARLLTALARVTLNGQTLFLIDKEPQRLRRWVAMLTGAFPEPMRPALTFSTYHDRPEELPGFRIQGTVPAARPNRTALLGLGSIADLGAGSIEPSIEPARWATTLAGWLVRDDETAWTRTNERAQQVWTRRPPEAPWTDDWLDGLIGVHAATLRPEPPTVAEDWAALTRLTAWARDAGLAAEWAQVRGPRWWIAAAESGTRFAEARAALLAHAGLPEAWDLAAVYKAARQAVEIPGAWQCGDPVAAWGEAVGLWSRQDGPRDRFAAVASILAAAPPASRQEFLKGVVKALAPPVAEEVLARLRADEAFDRSLLLPLEVQMAAGRLLDGSHETALPDVLKRACAAPPDGLVAVLDALADVAAERPGAARALAVPLADILKEADRLDRPEVLDWALRQDSARDWLGPYLHEVFAPPHDQELWRQIRARTPAERWPHLARVVLGVAGADGRCDEAFLWGIEELLVPLNKAERRRDPGLPRAYLDRIPGDIPLFKKLFFKGHRKPGLKEWLDEARANDLRDGRHRITAEQHARIVRCETFHELLVRQDAPRLRDVALPAARPSERAWLLKLLVKNLAARSSQAVELCLDACRRAWGAEAFHAGTTGLRDLAGPVAEALVTPSSGGGAPADGPSTPDRWFGRLRRALDLLGVPRSPELRFQRDGLAAEVVAATSVLAHLPFTPWELRRFLLQSDEAWMLLAADIRHALPGDNPAGALTVFRDWNDHLEKGTRSARFFELFLNACDEPAFWAIVPAGAAEMKTLAVLPWWDAGRIPGARADLRDRFARSVPIAPMPYRSLASALEWLDPPQPGEIRLARRAEDPPEWPLRDARSLPLLSPVGRARWLCVEEVSKFADLLWVGPETLAYWIQDLPLDPLDRRDAYRFLAWLIYKTDPAFQVHYPLDLLAQWLVRMDLTDGDRLQNWVGDLPPGVEVNDERRRGRKQFVDVLCDVVQRKIHQLDDSP
jgi:hypothetical protein